MNSRGSKLSLLEMGRKVNLEGRIERVSLQVILICLWIPLTDLKCWLFAKQGAASNDTSVKTRIAGDLSARTRYRERKLCYNFKLAVLYLQTEANTASGPPSVNFTFDHIEECANARWRIFIKCVLTQHLTTAIPSACGFEINQRLGDIPARKGPWVRIGICVTESFIFI